MSQAGLRARPEVNTTRGTVRGAWRHHVSADGAVSTHAVFRGIPYAAPPVGPARFAAPHAPTPWEAVRDAVAFGPTAQGRSPYDYPSIPEPSIPGDDILTVNVTTPDPSHQAGLPVLVWIHGGGFEGGSPASPWYVGESFARDGVVCVTLGYRLGVEGFGWVEDAVTNRGVRDWLAGLAWVKREIARFGGDPDRVTIAGQSAGGAAVMRLLTMPVAQPLFTAALAISPPDASATLEESQAAGERIARAAGVERPTRAEFETLTTEALFEARSAARVMSDSIDRIVAEAGHPLALGPVVDSDLIPFSVSEGLAHGVGADKPLLIGATSHEFLYLAEEFAPLVSDADPRDLLASNGLPAVVVDHLVGLHPSGGAPWALAQAASDAIFRAPVAGWADLRRGASAPTWAYDFRWESQSPTVRGAAHCLDVPFGFDILGGPSVDQLTGEAPQCLADAVHADWLGVVTGARVEAPEHRVHSTTVVYGRDGDRSVGPGYAPERAMWHAIRPGDDAPAGL